MSVLIETSEGDLVIDLFVEKCPKSCTNFLKLCKSKYYNFSPFFNVQKDFSCQSGDPLYPKGNGGKSVWGGYFIPEKNDYDQISHRHRGTISFAGTGKDLVAGSQFIITLKDDLGEQLDEKASVFGQVVEGFETLDTINSAAVDESKRPFKDIRIKHTYILDDPFEDPEGLVVPPKSPDPTDVQLSTVRLTGEEPEEEDTEEKKKEREAQSQALTLEMVGDLPFADVKPQENVLFVCKLNPVTNDEDLELIFSRFGTIVSCEVVRDKETGESLQYAFIEYEKKEDCERAYLKMEGVLIDDHRIHVDFSQSVARLARGPKPGKYRSDERRSDRRHYERDRSKQTDKRYPRYDDRYDRDRKRRRDERSPSYREERKSSRRERSPDDRRRERRSHDRRSPEGRRRREERSSDRRRERSPDDRKRDRYERRDDRYRERDRYDDRRTNDKYERSSRDRDYSSSRRR
ncbi:hypothetical protein TRVA0_007S02718 [Trichomonascus vanleenenianus]|uniref:PPIL4 family peptidylprolyl isomerase n=1 Tax=Trichomonascus vanleenenianus TaxID=2268995 RepID=UPI003EC9790F